MRMAITCVVVIIAYVVAARAGAVHVASLLGRMERVLIPVGARVLEAAVARDALAPAIVYVHALLIRCAVRVARAGRVRDERHIFLSYRLCDGAPDRVRLRGCDG